MSSYKEKIQEVIGESELGLTTVDVAKKAGVSKTTVIKYLSMLSSEGLVEFVEIGPSKLWRNKNAGAKHATERAQTLKKEAFAMVDIELCNGENKTVCFSFRVDPDRICALLRRANRCMCKATDIY